ncbi:histidine triad nucleotide-binding protein [bacterium]|nr:histidine triad nucleotide-binding protein [bacterium]MBL7052249.1 histidine triad nucleotide-binding protein [Candidatus Neomarinimicrobiota bacterium]
MDDCIFCKIASGEMGTEFVATSENCVAFHDLDPQAPIHILVVPKKHTAKISDLEKSDADLIGEMTYLAKQVAEKKHIENYRLVMNCGEKGGQSVWHIHMHLLGGRIMQWPPG